MLSLLVLPKEIKCLNSGAFSDQKFEQFFFVHEIGANHRLAAIPLTLKVGVKERETEKERTKERKEGDR